MKNKKTCLGLLACLLLFSMCTSNKENQTYVHPVPEAADTNVVLPPSWAFGVLYGSYTNQQETVERVDEIIAHDYPIDAYWIDSWFWDHANEGKGPKKYMDFVADTIGYPDRKAMWDYLQKQGVKGGFWAWDCIFQTGNEEAFADFEEKGYFLNTYVESNPWHNNSTTTAMFQTEGGSKKGTLCGNIDFNNPEAVAYFKQRMKHFFDEGADFIKLDRTSAINVCKVMFEMSQEFGRETQGRGFLLSHTGGVESEEFKRYPGKWTDDTRSDWTIEKPTKNFNSWVPAVALKENIAMFNDTARKSSCNIPFLANDMGGFDMGITDQLDEELFIRWLQFSQFNPIVEAFSQPENPSANLAYRYSERADRLFRQYTHLRMELFPYVYSYAHKTRLEGELMMRKLPGQIYEYLFGNELFVAPVYEQGATEREFMLPAGKWVNYWNGDVLEGGQMQKVAAPIEQIPLLVRQGSIIPMRAYARSIEQGTNDVLTLHVYPGANSTFTLIEDDGTSNDYLKGIYAKTDICLKMEQGGMKVEIAPLLGYYEGMNQERSWRVCIHGGEAVKGISCNGTDLQVENAEGTVSSSLFTSDKYQPTVFNITY